MSRIYVEFDRLNQISEGCEAAASGVDEINREFQQTVRQLDWDVRFQSDINSVAVKLGRKLEDYHRILKMYKSFVELAEKDYRELDAVEFELKIQAGQTNIFDGTSGYGGDQGDMMSHHGNVGWLFLIYNKDKDLFDFVRTQKGYEKYSDYDICNLFEKINKEGCGYVALVNTLFMEFPGSPAEFEQLYGFPMRDKDGNYNFNRMLIDLYCKTDDKYFLMESSGENAKISLASDVKDSYWKDDQFDSAKFEKDYGIKYTPSPIDRETPDEVIEKILDHFDSEVATFRKDDGTDRYTVVNRLEAYLRDKGINADVRSSYSSIMSAEQARNTLESGKTLSLGLTKGAPFCDESGAVIETLGGNHWVSVTDITEDGKYVVSSYGKKYYYDPSSGYTDPHTGEFRSYVDDGDCVTLDVIYK